MIKLGYCIRLVDQPVVKLIKCIVRGIMIVNIIVAVNNVQVSTVIAVFKTGQGDKLAVNGKIVGLVFNVLPFRIG